MAAFDSSLLKMTLICDTLQAEKDETFYTRVLGLSITFLRVF